jgi:hypothetical protein
MNLNSATVLDPVFQFLHGIIAEYGVYLFLAIFWLSVGCWPGYSAAGCAGNSPLNRTSGRHRHIIQPHTPPIPPMPTLIHEYEPPDDGMD